MEEEQVLTGYNPRIMRRLLRYAKPYWVMVAAALISLAVGTSGDLLLPVVIQRAVDNNLVVRYTRVPPDKTDALEGVDLSDSFTLTQATYVPEKDLETLSGVDRSRLADAGILSETGYYVFPYDDTLVASFDGTFESVISDSAVVDGTSYAAISATAMDNLTEEQRRLVRADDLEALRHTTVTFFILPEVRGGKFRGFHPQMAGNPADIRIRKKGSCGLTAIGTLQAVRPLEFLPVQLLHEGIQGGRGFSSQLFKETAILRRLLGGLLL